MKIERAIEILDPEHREQYESLKPVNEACRMDMVTHIERQAQIINTRLRSRNAEAAASFRAMLGVLFADPTSPVWEDGPEVRQGIDFFSVTREKSRGGIRMRTLRKEPGAAE